MVTIFLFLVVSSVAAFSTDGRWNSARELWDRSWNSTGLFCWLFFGASAVASVCIGILDFTIIIYSFHLRGTNSFFFYHFFIFYPFTVLDSNVVRLGKQRCRCLVFPFFFFCNLLTGQKNVCCLIIHSVSVGLKLVLFFFKEKMENNINYVIFVGLLSFTKWNGPSTVPLHAKWTWRPTF